MSSRRTGTLSMSEARASFAQVLTRAERGEPVRVTRGGRPVVVIVSVEDYERAHGRAASPSEALRSFLKTVDRRVLGEDDWKGVRDLSAGRGFRW
jgi:prevent-host-death family protein